MTVVPRDSRSSSTRPFPIKNTKKTGTQKLEEFRKATSGSNAGKVTVKTPSTQEERLARMRITSTGERRAGIDRTRQELVKIQDAQQKAALEAAIARQTPQKSLLDMFIAQKNVSQAKQLNNIRTVMGSGYKQPTLGIYKQYAMQKALKEDVKNREQRIETRASKLNALENSVKQSENNLKSYDKYISNGKFTGTQTQYNNYQKAYADYSTKVDTYNRTVELHNEDIKQLKKNNAAINKKTYGLKTYNKIKSVYTSAEARASSKLPTMKQAEPYIRDFVRSGTPLGQITKVTDSILNRNDTERIVQFHVGMYGAVQTKPLKAAATFATFFVGGIGLKGLSTAAKTLGAGAKTTKAARAIEAGIVTVYVGSTGKKFMEAKTARQLGYVTGDVIFNELLPAGLGLKYGIKVVSSIPKGTRRIRFKKFLASEKAQVGGSRHEPQTKTQTKAEFQKEFDRILKRTTEKAIKNARSESIRPLTQKEINNIRNSIARNKRKELEELVSKTAKQKAREENTLANQISRQFKKEKVNQAKTEFEQKTDTLKGSAKEPTITNIKQQSENIVKKAIRLQQKYEAGSISKATYDRQKASIMKMAKDIEELKKYAVELGKKPIAIETPKSISSAMHQTKQVIDAQVKADTSTRTGFKPNIKAFVISKLLMKDIVSAALQGKTLPASRISAVAKQRMATMQQPATTAATATATATATKPYVKTRTPAVVSTTIQEAANIVKQAEKTKTKTKTKTKSSTATIKPPELLIPEVPKISSDKKSRKKRISGRKAISVQTVNNRIATFKDLFG